MKPAIRFRIPAKPGTGGRTFGPSPSCMERGSLSKPFLTYDQQVAKLTSKGLAIPDEEAARAALRDVGYFALVNGYKGPLQDAETRRYKPGASFGDLVELYGFDASLRSLLRDELDWLERKLKSTLSHSFCERRGEEQSAYLDPASYTDARRHRKAVAKLVSILDYLANKNIDHAYIAHYRNHHGSVPLWVLVGAITFGQMSKMYSYLRSSEKAAVAKQFDHVNERQLEQMLKVLVLYRNVCAHGERLFSHRAYSEIPDMPLHAKLGIPKQGEHYSMGKSDLFSVVIALRYLLPRSRFHTFKRKLASLVGSFLRNSPIVNRGELLGLMGFPENWEQITRYRL